MTGQHALTKAARQRGAAVARAGARVIGEASGSHRMLPGFLIAGAQRCGTTSMYKTLKTHRDVLGAVMHKGVHYFDVGYDHSMAWYRGHFPLTSTARRHERRTGVRPITGESSPYYLFHPLAPQRIAADLPGVKVIVLVRDPAERAHSAYVHERARGFEDAPSFEAALDRESERLQGEEERLSVDPGYRSPAHRHNAYLARGRYIEQLLRLERHLGRDNIHVVDSQRFFDDPEPVYRAVIEFLDLPFLGYPTFEQHNARARDTLPSVIRNRLDGYFAPYDEQLADWLGWTPSWRTR